MADLSSLAGRTKVAAVTLGADTATIDFAGIPAGLGNLFLLLGIRGTNAAVETNVGMRLNNDSGANYQFEFLGANTSTASASSTTGQTSAVVATVAAATATAGKIGIGTVLIPAYDGTTFLKSYLSSFYEAQVKTGQLGGVWASAAAINRITLINLSGLNFLAGSFATLYADA